MSVEPDSESQGQTRSQGEITAEGVLPSLDAIVTSPAFGRSPRPARFLRHLVETALRGEPHLLKESVLGTDVFDRPATWDPRLDPVVRQEAARLRKRLANYYEANPTAEIRIELPVGTYVPVFRRHVDVAETPAPEALGTEGQAVQPQMVRADGEPSVPESQSTVAASKPPSPLWPYAAALLVCAIAGLIGWRAGRPGSGEPSIVVLPFTDLTADPATQYFVDGLTEEVTDSLARLKNVRVIARSSAVQFKNKNADIREAGRLLHVTNVLEGSVEKSGNRIRIIAHLERVADGAMIWSNKYESGTSNLFELQSELAAGIANGLRSAAAPAPTHVPNPEAHDLVMKGRYDLQQLTPDSQARAEAEYRRAIGLDPEYPQAYLGLGTVKFNQFAVRGSVYPNDEERKEAERWIRKSLELDPSLPSAHALLGSIAMQYDWDWTRAEHEFQAGIAGGSSVAESHYALFLVYHGRFGDAEPHIQRLLEIDPFSTATLNNLSLVRNLEGRFAASREAAQRMGEQSPRSLPPQLMAGITYVEEGHPDLGMGVFRAMEPRFPQAPALEGVAAAAAGRRDEALRLLRPFEDNWEASGVPMQWLAFAHAYLKDDAGTLKWLERSADRHEFQALTIAVHPVFAALHNNPRFQALKKRMGL